MIALYESYKAGLFQSHNWVPNMISGTIVGIAALPLAMAFAIASGATAAQGIYTAVIAAIIVGLFGGTRVQIAGPTGAFIVVLASITSKYGIEGLQIATLMAGIILTLMGGAKIGNLIKFIPDPVIVGFTSGIGVIIFFSAWKDFFGLPAFSAPSLHFHEKFVFLLRNLPSLNLTTTCLSSIALGLMLFSSKVPLIKRIPPSLLALSLPTLIQALFRFPDVDTIGNISIGIPSFHWPAPSLSTLIELIGPAFTIAILGAIESLLSAVVADGMTGAKHNSNQELIGQGLANIVCPFFGGFASTGAIARTVLNIRNGGNCPLAAVVHSLILVIIVALLAPFARFIPLCALASILFVIAYNMSDVPHFYHMLRHAPKNDIVVLLTTFFLTVFTDLIVAVNVGVILAIFLFTRRMSQAISIEQETSKSLRTELDKFNVTDLPSNVVVYNIQGPFFFAASETLEHSLAITHTDPAFFIIRLKNVPFMDVTGLQTFQEILEKFHKRGVKVLLCEANPRVYKKLKKMEIFRLIYERHLFPTLEQALERVLTV